jgi:hypothetical protein
MARHADCVVGARQTFFAMGGFPKTIVANASRYILRIDCQCCGTWWARFTNQFVGFVSAGKTTYITHARRVTRGHTSTYRRRLRWAKCTGWRARFLCVFANVALSAFLFVFFWLLETTGAL